MSNIWIGADFHWHHKNIVRGESEWKDKSRCRDFDFLEQYNCTIIDNINEVVKEKDTFYMLGDIVFGGIDYLPVFLSQLRCKNLHLVYGNHDIQIRRHKEYHHYFKSINDILIPRKGIKGIPVVMCHYAVLNWYKKARGSIHVYGHSHAELGYHKNAVCVSLDCHPGLRPFNFDEVLDVIKNRPNDFGSMANN